MNKEIKRHTRVVRLFPNEEALIRLVNTILIEISEQRKTGPVYLDMTIENENADSSQIYRKNVA